MNIAFLGNFAHKKGSTVFRQVVSRLGDAHSWYVFGFVGDHESFNTIKNKVVKNAVYADNELPTLFEDNTIDVVLVLSIWPETFSKTFFEAMKLGVPVIAFRVGFPAECLPEWPFFVDLNAGADGVVKLIESITPQKLHEAKELCKSTSFFEQYTAKARKKYELVDTYLTASEGPTARAEK